MFNAVSFHYFAAVILLLISLPGVLMNIYLFIKLSSQTGSFSGFHKLCIIKTMPNTIVCLSFLLWSAPLSFFSPAFKTIPRHLNVLVGQIAGWGAYILGPILQVFMSFNRFFVLFFQTKRFTYVSLPVTNISICAALIIAIIYTIIGLPAECGFVFDPDILSWRPEYFQCAEWLANFIFFSVLSISTISNILNFSTFIRLISFKLIAGISISDSAARRKRRIQMYIQSVVQDSLHIFDMLNCTIFFKLNDELWYGFLFLSVSFLSIHALDGFVMFYFHPEVHPKIFSRKNPKNGSQLFSVRIQSTFPTS